MQRQRGRTVNLLCNRNSCLFETSTHKISRFILEYEKKDDIVMLDRAIVVYRQVSDVTFYVCGSYEENEIILDKTLETIKDTVSHILRGQVDKRSILENMDYVFLTIDETIDSGVIMETEYELIAQRVNLRSPDTDLPIGEQTISQALKTAKDKILENLAN